MKLVILKFVHYQLASTSSKWLRFAFNSVVAQDLGRVIGHARRKATNSRAECARGSASLVSRPATAFDGRMQIVVRLGDWWNPRCLSSRSWGQKSYEAIEGYGLDGTVIALLGRVGGGICTSYFRENLWRGL